ncbi:von Willebrand factor type A domain-containing protein [Aliiroseovarius halocynthiae]|uniref:VWA domain-containing protein n=1 Tax=Aliiroseovarius halocynthiae TaxID=985055 RepID=A0A545SQC7_9RHOB|nr:VWA domain-containing protein [Aliiroseovarius halocynthiae]TQV67164.1 VWA domain-containing protein [Aliiroseovarius halocynthiae]SMR82106.1 von Willebrand factor type A domain-containing protein [Aliiroseovarius halocynthiae]
MAFVTSARRWGAGAMLGALVASAGTVQAQDDLMVVFDASGSMWGQVGGQAKIEIARSVFADISGDWLGSGQSVGLIAYGHRRKGDCSDIEMLSPPSTGATAGLAGIVQGLSPRGKTPLTQAVRMAAEELKYTENAATVVLLTDGKETCNLDPCAVGAELEQLGVNFTAHVVGFDIREQAEKAQLQCLAQATGGRYVDARDAKSLADALSSVSGAPDEPTGTLPVRLTLTMAAGTVRPASVTLGARNAETGEMIELAKLDGADQVISGVNVNLPAGVWAFTANGDGGNGEIKVALSEATEEIAIPFKANNGLFELQAEGPFLTDGTISVQVRSLTTLQQNATYNVMLFIGGATEFDQHITYSYRFGFDDETTEHNFFPWEYGLPAGEYEILVLQDGTYDLSENLGRISVELFETGADLQPSEDAADAASSAQSQPSIAQLVDPVRAGMSGALLVSGPFWANDEVLFIGLDGQETQSSLITDDGSVLVPPGLEGGVYRLELYREDGSRHHLEVVDILPQDPQSTVSAEDQFEDTGAMLSPEELAAENGGQEIPFSVWKACDGDIPCRVLDKRVGLEWALPLDWISEEPFYYVTAAGAQAEYPTVHMARARNGAMLVALNPRQWDTQTGPCEDVPQGMLCRDETEVVRDLADYALIRDSLLGVFPSALGDLPLGRSWTIEDKALGQQIGLLKFEQPEERAANVKALLKLSDSVLLGISDSPIVEAELALNWGDDAKIGYIDGTFDVNGVSIALSLSRPSGWDGTSNQWSGQILNMKSNRGAIVRYY